MNFIVLPKENSDPSKYIENVNKSDKFNIILEDLGDSKVNYFCANCNIEFCNFFIYPIEIIKSPDLKIKKYIFNLYKNTFGDCYRVELNFNELENAKWLNIISPFLSMLSKPSQNYKKLLEYIDTLITKTKPPISIEYDTIGWVQYQNNWIFLHSGGAIGYEDKDLIFKTSIENVNLCCDDLIENKTSFKVDLEKIAVEKTLDMLDICNPSTTISLFSLTLMSIILTPLLNIKEVKPDFNMWLFGIRGYGKTGISSLFTRIFNIPNVLRVDSYKKEYKHKLKSFKDSILILDDYGVAKTTSRQASITEKVEDIIRSVSDSSVLADKTFKTGGVILFTGETFLGNEDSRKFDLRSSKDRCIIVQMDNIMNEKMIDNFSEDKKNRYLDYAKTSYMSRSYKYYIEWLSNDINGNMNIYSEFFNNYLKDINGMNARRKNAYAHLMASFKLYMKYAFQFIKSDEYENQLARARMTMMKIIDDQDYPLPDFGIEIFFKSMKNLIDTKEIIIPIHELSFRKRINLSDEDIDGELMINKGVLKIKWTQLYEKVCEHVREYYPFFVEDIPEIRVFGNRLKKLGILINIIGSNRNNSTMPVKTIDGQVRLAGFRTKFIYNEILESIKNKKNCNVS